MRGEAGWKREPLELAPACSGCGGNTLQMGSSYSRHSCPHSLEAGTATAETLTHSVLKKVKSKAKDPATKTIVLSCPVSLLRPVTESSAHPGATGGGSAPVTRLTECHLQAPRSPGDLLLSLGAGCLHSRRDTEAGERWVGFVGSFRVPAPPTTAHCPPPARPGGLLVVPGRGPSAVVSARWSLCTGSRHRASAERPGRSDIHRWV